MDDADERVTHHVVAQLTFHDAWAKALVHKLATSRLAALQILAGALGSPGARLAGAAADTELDELTHGVLLRVVVVGLHQVQHLIVRAAALTEGLAIVPRLQLD